MRRLADQFVNFEFADGVDIWQQVGADHQREDVYRDEDGSAHGKHDEQPLGDVCWFVDLKLHHRDLKYKRVLQVFVTVKNLLCTSPEGTAQRPTRFDSSAISL